MIEHRRVTDCKYLIDWAIADGTDKKDAEDTYKKLLFAYEAWEDGELLGTAYATYRKKEYTLDGYNRTGNFFGACNLGREVINELFDTYTDVIYTYHDTDKRSVTALARRLGFVEDFTAEDMTIFKLEKKNGNE